jgi:hypothetical protein
MKVNQVAPWEEQQGSVNLRGSQIRKQNPAAASVRLGSGSMSKCSLHGLINQNIIITSVLS